LVLRVSFQPRREAGFVCGVAALVVRAVTVRVLVLVTYGAMQDAMR